MDQLKKLLDYLEPKFKKIHLLLWMIVGLLLSIGSFFFDNTVVIKNNKIQNELKKNYLQKNKSARKDKSVFENIYFQKNQSELIAIDKYNSMFIWTGRQGCTFGGRLFR